jgi:hypothetical protein
MKNFGKLKNIFNTILAEGISEKSDLKKDIFKKYVKTLKENKILKSQFDAYTKIESMVEENEFKATEKIKKILESMKEFGEKEIYEANNKLFNLTKGRNIDEDYKRKELHENITNLIFSKDVDTYVDSLHETVEYAKSNTTKEIVESIGVPNSLLASLAIGKFNDRYNDLDETTKKAIKIIVEGDEESKKEIFSESIKECLELVNERLKDAEPSIKESLLLVKENLLGRTFNSETFKNDIVKILDLKQDLN